MYYFRLADIKNPMSQWLPATSSNSRTLEWTYVRYVQETFIRMTTNVLNAQAAFYGEQWHCPSCVQSCRLNSDSSTLPAFVHCRDIGSVVWGELKGEEVANEINKAYITVIKWKKNLFKLPGGKCGNSFVSEIGNLIDLWVDKSKSESIALTALHVFVPLMLQKPSKKSKNRDHIRYLTDM